MTDDLLLRAFAGTYGRTALVPRLGRNGEVTPRRAASSERTKPPGTEEAGNGTRPVL